jgi:hypothetical protein
VLRASRSRRCRISPKFTSGCSPGRRE